MSIRPNGISLRHWLPLVVTSLLGLAGSAGAEVATVMFQSNMVLQREMSVPVFGTAAPGEAVTVTFCGQSKTTTAETNGQWQVKLEPLTAGGPFEMTIQGQNTLLLTNVMVGEVWLCAGQSNMGYSMKKIGGSNVVAAAEANYPNIRFRTMKDRQGSTWEVLTPDVCLKSSATAYYFGQQLHTTLDVPVGLIVCSSPGTAIRYWLDPAATLADAKLGQQPDAGRGGKWYREVVQPVIPYGIRGAIWYQGESDTDGNLPHYQARFLTLIRNYRQNWGQGDFPFLYVQIASFGPTQTEADGTNHFAELRASQTLALALTNTAMAVTIDIGDPDWHPKNKWDVGRRLALPALRRVYHRSEILEDSGPMLLAATTQGGEVRLQFTHTQGGLVFRGNDPIQGFAVCGSDHQWHWAKALIREEAVVLTCAAVPEPRQVRYAWADCPIATPLYNGAGLPAVPFQADLPQPAGK